MGKKSNKCCNLSSSSTTISTPIFSNSSSNSCSNSCSSSSSRSSYCVPKKKCNKYVTYTPNYYPPCNIPPYPIPCNYPIPCPNPCPNPCSSENNNYTVCSVVQIGTISLPNTLATTYNLYTVSSTSDGSTDISLPLISSLDCCKKRIITMCNTSGFLVTISPNSSNTINGLSSFSLDPNTSVQLISDTGINWAAI